MSPRLDYQAIASPALRDMAELHRRVAHSSLPPTPRSISSALRVSQIKGCAYSLSVYNRDQLKQGVPLAKLMLLEAWHETGDVYSECERAALQWAESLTLVPQTGAPDADYGAVVANFDDKDVVDLSIAIG